ncbi:hypothetical protein G4B88_027667 [Cannabis sativa]|uniref:Uncharacterized protein n=1 Tax=Cannabis sativa TaxID=3483 RepID=A0A7J6DP82_CANSA|nr:hypothetical protein G4B88_027667 [Cannabis sativa]
MELRMEQRFDLVHPRNRLADQIKFITAIKEAGNIKSIGRRSFTIFRSLSDENSELDEMSSGLYGKLKMIWCGDRRAIRLSRLLCHLKLLLING